MSLLVISMLCIGPFQGDDYPTYKQAHSSAKANGKPIMVFVTADW